jgi:hypothetical protein
LAPGFLGSKGVAAIYAPTGKNSKRTNGKKGLLRTWGNASSIEYHGLMRRVTIAFATKNGNEKHMPNNAERQAILSL